MGSAPRAAETDSTEEQLKEELDWVCGHCGLQLAPDPVYLDDYRLATLRDGDETSSMAWMGGNILSEHVGGMEKVFNVALLGLDENIETGPPAGPRETLVTDQVESFLAGLDDTGEVVRGAQLGAFGELRLGPDPGRVGFAGARRHQATGYSFMRNRWYDPKLGRFLGRDPIGFAGGLNQFAFVENDPARHRDPLGLLATAWIGGNAINISLGIGVVANEKLVKSGFDWRGEVQIWQQIINEFWQREASYVSVWFEGRRLGVNFYAALAPGITNAMNNVVMTNDEHEKGGPASDTNLMTRASGNWSQVQWGAHLRGRSVVAHEVGHLLWLDDEYVRPGVQNQRYQLDSLFNWPSAITMPRTYDAHWKTILNNVLTQSLREAAGLSADFCVTGRGNLYRTP